MASLAAPYATGSDGCYGPVAGSCPDWASSTFLDRGRHHTAPITSPAGPAAGGWEGWYDGTQSPASNRLRRAVEGPQSACYAEPVVQGAHSSYYTRRNLPEDSPEAFRRSLRHIPPAVQADRGCRVGHHSMKRQPTNREEVHPRAPWRPTTPVHQGYTAAAPSGQFPEPSMPRLSRPYGATILRESDQELSYERALGRKIRVGQDTYRGSGRAGDLSLSFAPPRRPEDDAMFFKSLKDSPTFTRFVNSLPPKPAVGPHQRRAEEIKRATAAERQAEQKLVEMLSLQDAEPED